MANTPKDIILSFIVLNLAGVTDVMILKFIFRSNLRGMAYL